MIFKQLEPSPHIKGYVKNYLLIHFQTKGFDTKFVKPAPPVNEQCLVFYPRNLLVGIANTQGKIDKRGKSVLVGQATERVDFHIDTSNYLCLKVVFWPGALSQILGLPLSEIVNQSIDADSVLGSELNNINEQLTNYTDYQNLLNIIENFLFAKIKKLKAQSIDFVKIAHQITANIDQVNVDKLADFACYSNRKLEREFLNKLGLSPKFFIRICRFELAFKQKQQNPSLSWLDIALQNGYNDYQHLVRDFTQFTGVRPNIILNSEMESPERRFGLVARQNTTR